jgi:hypothetical protein
MLDLLGKGKPILGIIIKKHEIELAAAQSNQYLELITTIMIYHLILHNVL